MVSWSQPRVSSTVINETLLRCLGRPTYACTYFFFDNRSAEIDQVLHDKLIRSIMQQPCDRSDGVPAPLVDIYGNRRHQVSVASLQSILEKIIDGFERTYIIIDALDECTNKEKVLARIEELMQRKAGYVHILFSSRPEQDITDKIQCMAYIDRVTLNNRLPDKEVERLSAIRKQ
ncbi:hypothetical protein FIBSPDRAFT_107366 [Athelia psychrophila]|uniref:Nephrocystin 3-like N-terminal domain-containing protein n=1 Tax=Athelia psychrophila TaxID=1759441 RepID=A0A166D6L7_9AGAM|nr:hypothetical protein FIBSPDRAFT_107366 [Fibularhizoctonia sp. CBS 109695]